MRSDYARQLKFIHDELGIERVRFHGIFDDDMQAIMSMADMMPMPGAEKFQNYNFFNIFAAYDNVLAAGIYAHWRPIAKGGSSAASKPSPNTSTADEGFSFRAHAGTFLVAGTMFFTLVALYAR